MRPDIQDTCDSYVRQVEIGGDPGEIVTGLAAYHNVNRPAIWRRLRSGGVLPSYNTGTGPRRRNRRTMAQINSDREEQPRVERDPCPRCGTRADVGCRHSLVQLGTVF